MKFYDLNVPLEDCPSEPIPITVEHQTHPESASFMVGFFDAPVEDLPEGNGWANDTVTLIAHAGTHVDAPWHYYPTCGGERARTIDELPLDWFYGDGVVLDMRHKEQGGLITVKDLQAALAKIDYTLKPMDIVLIQTDTDKLWGRLNTFQAGPGSARPGPAG